MHSLHRPHPRALRRKPPERSPRSSPSTHRIARAHHPRPRDRQRPSHAHTRNPRAHDASQKRYNTYITEFIAFDFSRDALVVKQPQLVVIVDLDLLLRTRRRVRDVELLCARENITPPSSARALRNIQKRARSARNAVVVVVVVAPRFIHAADADGIVVGFSHTHPSAASARRLPRPNPSPRAHAPHARTHTHPPPPCAPSHRARRARTFMTRRVKRPMARRPPRVVAVARGVVVDRSPAREPTNRPTDQSTIRDSRTQRTGVDAARGQHVGLAIFNSLNLEIVSRIAFALNQKSSQLSY